MANSLVIAPSGVKVLPDNGRYVCRFEVHSESSNNKYMVSFDTAPGAGYWKCSCMGYIRHGQCKHLSASGLKGRKFGVQIETLAKLGLR